MSGASEGRLVPDATQRRSARVAGLAYLLALPLAVFAEFFVLGRLVRGDDAAATARNIVAHERLFRLGIASNLAVFALDVVLIVALYITLKPVGRPVALVALGWRMIETGLLATTALRDLDVLGVLGGASYLRALPPESLAATARLALASHGATYNVALVFAGLGSAAFCWLWIVSGWVPRALAGLGLFASVLMAVCTGAFVVAPELHEVISVGVYGGPIFLFELAMGCWLAVRGLRSSA